MTETVERDRSREGTEPPSGWRPPEILGPVDTARWAWRKLRKMSTAIWLLFGLAAASVVATFIPQEPVIPTTVESWRAGIDGPGSEVAAVFDALGLFDVYGSWWFGAVVVLLFVSLTGCLVPRWRAFLRSVRREPVRGRGLSGLSNARVYRTGQEPDAALATVEGVLRRRRYRRRRLSEQDTESGRAQVAAERGHSREGGSLVFHSAFYVLLVGILVAQAFGFIGQVNVVEGRSFADTRISYDLAEPGPLFGLDDHRGFSLRLDDFDVAWFPDGTPERFVSTVTVLEGGQELRTEQVEVNHRLEHAGMNVYQMRFGMAPHLTVSSGDTLLYDDQLALSQADADTWAGVAKVSVADPQIALEVLLVPSYGVEDGEIVNRGPQPDEPRLFANLWVGELGLERTVPSSEFDRDGGQRLDAVELGEGDSAQLLDGAIEIAFPELTMWSGFQVAHQPGRSILLASGVLVLAGLIPSLYAYRRRVWAEARPTDGGGSEVVLAGVALHRRSAFDEEFSGLADDVGTALDAHAVPGEALAPGARRDEDHPSEPEEPRD